MFAWRSRLCCVPITSISVPLSRTCFLATNSTM
uniref:Uncharacterized protein n=1 Tax=Arundo donax TaxID=35708 RepID=A0A0A9HM68_ARUDO